MEVREGGEGRGVRVEREGGRTGAWHPSMAVRASSTASREVRFPTPPHLHHMPTTTLVPTHPVTHGHALTFSCACVQERKGTAALALSLLSHSRDVITALLVAASARAAALARPHAGRVGRGGDGEVESSRPRSSYARPRAGPVCAGG